MSAVRRAPRGNGRATRQLDATRRALCRTSAHPTAEEVFVAARRELPSVGLGTVYRNLQKLVGEGQARIVALPDRTARFDGRTDRHDHFVCRRCGRVVDVDPRLAAHRPSCRRVGRHRVDEVAVTYFGCCESCC